MSTQVALTFAAVSSGLLAGFFLALAIIVNLILGSGGDVRRIALRTAIIAGALGGVGALSTLGAIVTHLSSPDEFSITALALVSLVLVLVAAAVGIIFSSNTRHDPHSNNIARFRQSNWGAMAVSVAAFILNVVALGVLG
ncbi:MAG: hypothetical protein GC204_20605 [Chloroflexi bacterium]|nr:hypothetical protein [Chloroflexota bacterium]